MEERHVLRGAIALIGLQIVAGLVHLRREPPLLGRYQELVLGKQRRRSWAQVREDDAAQLSAGIGGLSNPLFERPALSSSKGAARWFTRLLETATIGVVQPAMVNT